MRTAEAMRVAGGDPREELSEVVGSACVGARVLSLARAAAAMHMAESARARAERATRAEGAEAAR